MYPLFDSVKLFSKLMGSQELVDPVLTEPLSNLEQLLMAWLLLGSSRSLSTP